MRNHRKAIGCQSLRDKECSGGSVVMIGSLLNQLDVDKAAMRQ